MTALQTRSLAEIADSVRYGYTASASDDPVGPKFLRITDIVPAQIDWERVPYCEIDESNLERFGLRPGDIVIARTGATVGYAKLIREETSAVFASYLVRIRIDSTVADPDYIGRVVESDYYRQFVLSRVGGSAQPNANAKVLSSFQLPIPPVPHQRRVASILTAYDDLIANNTRRIKLLEDAARLLYEEWFVRLRFPGHEHTPIHDGVPDGWERRPLKEVGALYYGKALKADDRMPGPVAVYGSSGIVGRHEKALVKGPGVIVGRKGNVGSVHLSLSEFWPIDTVYYVEPNSFSYYLLHDLRYQNFINGDSAVPGLNRNFAHSLPVLLPSKVIRHEFERQATVLYAQIDKLQQMNDKLTAARDLLIPRLIFGEVAI